MKHTVLMAFVEKESGSYYMPGSFFISDNEQRIKELAELHVIKPHSDFMQQKDLRAVAKQLKIKGYTKMSDEELEKAIAEHGGEGNDDTGEGEERTTD